MGRLLDNMNGRIVGLMALVAILALVGGLALASNRSLVPVDYHLPTNTPTALLTSPTGQSEGRMPSPALALSAPVTVTTNGYTLTLYPVSADASRVLVIYTVTAPAGHNAEAIYLANGITPYWELLGPTLSEGDGTPFPARLISASSLELDELLDISNPSTQATSVSSTKALAFDRTRLPNTSTALSLHLTGDLIAVKTITYTTIFLHPVTETIARNLSFDFQLPLDRTVHIADVNQTFRAGDITLMLDRVAVTPSEAVLFMRGRKEFGSNINPFQEELWLNGLKISTGAGQVGPQAGDYPLGNYSFQHVRRGDQWVIFYPGSFFNSEDQCTVSIEKVLIGPVHGDTVEEYRGPWTFHFTLAEPRVNTEPLALP